MARDRRRTPNPAPSRPGLLGTLRHDANAIMQTVANEVAPVVVFRCSPKSVAIDGDAIAAGGGVPKAIHY